MAETFDPLSGYMSLVALDDDGAVIATVRADPEMAVYFMEQNYPGKNVIEIGHSDRDEIAKDHAPWRHRNGQIHHKDGRVVRAKVKPKDKP